MSSNRRRLAPLARTALLCSAATAAFAIQPPAGDRPQERLIHDHPDVYVRQANAPVASVPGFASERELAQLGSPAAGSFVDLRTGRWARLQPVEPLLPGSGVGNRLSWEGLTGGAPGNDAELGARAWDAFAGWLERHAEALRIDPREVVSPGRVTVFSPDHIHIWAPRRVAGLEVRGSYLSASIRHGNLVLFGVENWGDVDGLGLASLSLDEAEASLARHAAATGLGASWREAELVWVPVSTLETASVATLGEGLGYRLAWAVRRDFGAADLQYEALVDAADGTVLSVRDTAHYVATPRRVLGGVLPVSNDGAPPDGVEQPGWPMPFSTVTAGPDTLVADAGGNLASCVDGSISSALAGPFVRMSDGCGAISLASTGDLNFGVSAGTDCTTPGTGGPGNTRSSRTGFFEINQLKAMAQSQLPANVWLQGQLTSNMNIPSSCNAFWNGSTINFYRSSASCRNTGEIAGVFDHEWGHGMDNNDAAPTIANPGEGIADIYASLRLSTSCIGRGFRLTGPCGGYGNPCDTCTGVRDIDWMARAADTPTTVTWINSNCGSGPAPCGGGVHCEGAVYSEAVWDLWNRDLTAGAFGYTRDRAREIATQLTYRGASPVVSWFTCSQGSGGCGATNGYLNYLAADDDNGNLNDGTPHMSAIHAAFNRHGIACATPTVTDSGCAATPSTPPAVTATPRDRGVKLEWTASAGATGYRVFRTDGVFACDFGKVLVGETDGLDFVDSGLQNGREYSYIVVPMGATDACFGAPSSCTAVTPAAGASLTALVESASYDTLFGDNDEFLDNCETTELTLPMSNVGTGALTNLEIVAASSPTHPGTAILSTLPVVVSPSLASCDNVDATLEFVANGLAPGDLFRLELEVAADEFGADNRVFTVEFDTTEGDFQLFASRQFDFEADTEGWTTIAGTFLRDTAGGGAGGSTAYVNSSEFLDGQCDIVRSPLMKLEVNSTMQFSTNMDIEENSGGWWDRANVSIFNPATNARTVVVPSGGRLYNASGVNGVCDTTGQVGWAGRTFNSWATSDWSSGALQTGVFAGIPTAIQVNYGTDPLVNGYGIRFDRVTVTNAHWQVADTLPDSCVADPMPFLADFEEGDFSEWSATQPLVP